MTEEVFRKFVAKAIDEIPGEFRERLDNVEIIVEDFPDQEIIDTMRIESKWHLLGLYVGAPLTNKSFFSISLGPDRIFLYRLPILRAAGAPQRIVAEIKDTLLHEIGHHFGFDDRDLADMENA